MYRELRKIGLTQYEAKIYKTLIEYGRIDAKEISAKSKVPPTAVYPNLKSLVSKELILKLDGDVANYKALPPETAIATFVENKKKKLSTLSENLAENAQKILGKKELFPPKEVVKISLGKQASTAIYDELISKSKKSLYIMGWRMHKIGDKYSWLKTYKKLIKKKVDVRLIVIGSGKKQEDLIRAYQKAGVKVRFLPLENFSLVVSDGRECKITLKGKNLKKKFNIQINDQDLSKAMQSYFLMSWEKAELFSKK